MRKNIRYFFVVVGVAFVLRALFLFAVGPDDRYALTPDSQGYIIPATTLLNNGSFSTTATPPFLPDTVRTPGYSIFLMPFVSGETPKIQAIVWAQAILGALTAGLVYLLALLLWKNNIAALFAGLGMSLDWVIILHTDFVMTEPVFLFLFVSSLLPLALFFKDETKKNTKLLAASGFLLGAASLVRPVSVYYFFLPAFILGCSGLWRKNFSKVKAAFLLSIFSFALPLLWMARNKMEANTWSLSTIQGITRAAILEERLSGRTYEMVCQYLKEEFHKQNPQSFSSPSEESSAQSRWALKFILSHPVDYAAVLAKESIKFFAGNSMKAAAWMIFKDPRHDPFTIIVHPKESNWDQASDLVRSHISLGVGLVAYLLLLSLVYAFSVVGFIVAWKKWGPELALFVFSSALYIYLVSIGMGAHSRYRIPAMPALFVLAGLGFQVALDRWREIRHV